ncbi:MAG: hypothetical protein SGILL_003449 [Bacillariaceae sp.]
MKKSDFDKLIKDGLTLYYLSPLRGTIGFKRTDMLRKVGMEDYLAESPFTLVSFNNVYAKMVQKHGYPLPPWHESFHDNDFRDRLVLQFNEIVVADNVKCKELMLMAGYRHQDVSVPIVCDDGKTRLYQTTTYGRLWGKTQRFRKAADKENAMKHEETTSFVPEEAHSTAPATTDTLGRKVLGNVNKTTNGGGIMDLNDISKALVSASQSNRETVLKTVFTTLSASEKENLRALVESDASPDVATSL